MSHHYLHAPQMYQMAQMAGAQSLEGRSLYVGNLDSRVTEALLYEVFSAAGGRVESCKLIKDKVFSESTGYGFVDFFIREDAERALQALNGRNIYDKEIKVNWAAHATNKEDTSNHFNVFVGDLSSDIDDSTLLKAFSAFKSVSDARVMWDQNTGRSRGYGFVAFRDRNDAERAMTDMNGAWIGSRPIRCNWANQKNSASGGSSASTSAVGSGGSQNFEEIASQTSANCTTVYVGNLAPEASEDQLRAIFQNYGGIEEIRIQKDKCFGFVKYQTHDQATRAIVAANGTSIAGRAVRCSWGKEKAGGSVQTQTPVYGGYYPAYTQNYMYNMQQYPYQYYPGHDMSQYYSGAANYDMYNNTNAQAYQNYQYPPR